MLAFFVTIVGAVVASGQVPEAGGKVGVWRGSHLHHARLHLGVRGARVDRGARVNHLVEQAERDLGDTVHTYTHLSQNCMRSELLLDAQLANTNTQTEAKNSHEEAAINVEVKEGSKVKGQRSKEVKGRRRSKDEGGRRLKEVEGR